MSSSFSLWKKDISKYVFDEFHKSYENRISRLSRIVGETDSKNIPFAFRHQQKAEEIACRSNDCFSAYISPVEYTLSIPINYKDAIRDKEQAARDVGMKLGNSKALVVYLHAIRMFGNAWTDNGYHDGGDGVPWASEYHQYKGKTYFSNAFSDTLCLKSIKTAQERANCMPEENDTSYRCKLDTVIISPDLEKQAKRLFGAHAKIDISSDNYNSFEENNVGMRYIVLGNQYDGFTGKQWAICDSQLMKDGAFIIYNNRPCVMQSPQDNPLKELYTAYVDFAVGWTDARQILFFNP